MKFICIKLLNFSILVIPLIGCNKFERKFKQLHTGKYTVEGVLFHSLTGKYDTLNLMSYGPYIGTNSCDFWIVLSKKNEPLRIYLDEIDRGNIINLEYLNTTIYSYNSSYLIEKDRLELIFNSSDTISGKIFLNRIE